LTLDGEEYKKLQSLLKIRCVDVSASAWVRMKIRQELVGA